MRTRIGERSFAEFEVRSAWKIYKITENHFSSSPGFTNLEYIIYHHSHQGLSAVRGQFYDTVLAHLNLVYGRL